jgi:hypothetical protein
MCTNIEFTFIRDNKMFVILENKFCRVEIQNMQTPLAHVLHTVGHVGTRFLLTTANSTE